MSVVLVLVLELSLQPNILTASGVSGRSSKKWKWKFASIPFSHSQLYVHFLSLIGIYVAERRFQLEAIEDGIKDDSD